MLPTPPEGHRLVRRGRAEAVRSRVDVGGLALATPVMIASGCAGTGKELAGLADLRKVGGGRARARSPRAARRGPPRRGSSSRASGVVWRHGDAEPGYRCVRRRRAAHASRQRAPVFVSIAGGTLEEYVRLTSILQGRAGGGGRSRCIVGAGSRAGARPCSARTPTGSTEVVGRGRADVARARCSRSCPGGVDVVALAVAAARAGATGLTLVRVAARARHRRRG